jgi:hypothetical protein
MFSEVDSVIFPKSCEVIQVASQHFVYPIFKCGRSSLLISMESQGWTFVPEGKISGITDPITVFLRDPKDRFVSGVNTYLQHLSAEGNQLDQHTVLYFINRYLFLNRHYAPQFFWLLNLARFSGVNALIELKPMTDISLLTDKHSHAMVDPVTDQLKQQIESFDWSKLELYLFLDQILLDHVGQTLTIADLIDYVKHKQPELYNLVFQSTMDITNVLPQT